MHNTDFKCASKCDLIGHLKEISSGCSLEGLMLKLRLQYFGHLMRRADSFEKTLMLGKIECEMPGASVRNSTRDKVMRQEL